jgi:hypothetical protein
MLATSIDRYACSAAGRSFCSEKIEQREGIPMLSGMTRIRRQTT